MERFDLLGSAARRSSTTVLEASAGTGKTFALAGLVTRYLAEGGPRWIKCCSSPSVGRPARSCGSGSAAKSSTR